MNMVTIWPHSHNKFIAVVLSRIIWALFLKYTRTKKKRRVHKICNTYFIAWPKIMKIGQIYIMPHVARVCQQFLTNSNIHPLDWPAFSPDLSPIEHLWDKLDRRVRTRPNAPTNHVQLTHALHEEWNNIPMAMINTLVNSMHRRIRAAKAAHGGHTRY